MDVFDRYYRVYASINLDYIENNIRNLKAHINEDTRLIAVIKTDGYGHGASMIAKYASDCVDCFAVATADEALQLIEDDVKKPILVLGYINEARYGQMIENNIRMTVFKEEDAGKISALAHKMGRKALIHIKVDTGMGRIGFPALNSDEITKTCDVIKKITAMPDIEAEGLYTHFALADAKDKSFANLQFDRFKEIIAGLEKMGINIPVKHCDNSAAIIDMPETNMDAVRAGIALYGLQPSDEIDIKKLDLKQAMEVKSHIIYIKDVDANTSIGYGRSFITERKTRVATIPVGYGDGYPRNLSNKGYVIVNGVIAPIIGRVCMDQFMVDITGIPDVKDGCVVSLAGADNGSFRDISELADVAGTFNYEFICEIGKRVPRIYYKDSNIVGTKDYFVG